MLITAYWLNVLGMILLPIALAFYVTRKFHLPWKLILAGSLTFIASQVLHIPVVAGLTAPFANGILSAIPEAGKVIFNAVVLGLLAGVFEETARWILFRFILKATRTWEEGVVVGTGYGGTEAILAGLLAASTVVSMIAMRNADLSAFGVPPEQLELARQQVANFWSAPVYMAFAGFIERVFAIGIQVSLSVMVLYSVAYKKPAWFWIALLWHAFVDAVSVYLAATLDTSIPVKILTIEAVVGICALISLVILFRLRPRFVKPETGTAEPAIS